MDVDKLSQGRKKKLPLQENIIPVLLSVDCFVLILSNNIV